jgi:predicted dehydrogenase
VSVSIQNVLCEEEGLKVAVVGLGKMGLLHAGILNTLSGVKLAAVCDKSGLIRRFFKKQLGEVQVVDDLEKLSGLGLDVVYVTTPISSHFPVTRAIYSRRIARNVFVEKTLASSYEEAREMCRLAQDSGGVSMVGYMKRFAVTFKKAKELLDQGALGDVASFDAYGYSSDFLGVERGSGTSGSRGGVLADLGSHVIDLALWFFGDLEVDSVRLESTKKAGLEDSVVFTMRNSKDLKGSFDVSWCKEGYRMPEFGLLVRGSEGIMRVDNDKVEVKLADGKSSRWHRHDLNDSVGFLLGDPEYFREDERFIRSVSSNEKVEPSFTTASRVDWIIAQVKIRAGQDG